MSEHDKREAATLRNIRARMGAMNGWHMGDDYPDGTLKLVKEYGDKRARAGWLAGYRKAIADELARHR